MTAAVLLAAGGGSRFAGRGHKLLAPFRGRRVFEWALDHALEADLGPTVVVGGAVDLRPLLAGRAVLLDNPDWVSGMASSLQCAVSWAAAAGHDAIVVGLGDQPLVPATAWRAVAASTAPVAVATFTGHRSPPVRLAAAVWSLLPSTGDVGARALMASHPELVTEVACPGEAVDIDTLEDLAR